MDISNENLWPFYFNMIESTFYIASDGGVTAGFAGLAGAAGGVFGLTVSVATGLLFSFA